MFEYDHVIGLSSEKTLEAQHEFALSEKESAIEDLQNSLAGAEAAADERVRRYVEQIAELKPQILALEVARKELDYARELIQDRDKQLAALRSASEKGADTRLQSVLEELQTVKRENATMAADLIREREMNASLQQSLAQGAARIRMRAQTDSVSSQDSPLGLLPVRNDSLSAVCLRSEC